MRIFTKFKATARKHTPISQKPTESSISNRSPDEKKNSKRKLFKLLKKKSNKNKDKKCINNLSTRKSIKNSYVIDIGSEVTDEKDDSRERVKDAKFLLGNLDRDIPNKILNEYENENYGIPKSYLIEWKKNETFTPIPSFVEARVFDERYRSTAFKFKI